MNREFHPSSKLMESAEDHEGYVLLIVPLLYGAPELPGAGDGARIHNFRFKRALREVLPSIPHLSGASLSAPKFWYAS